MKEVIILASSILFGSFIFYLLFTHTPQITASTIVNLSNSETNEIREINETPIVRVRDDISIIEEVAWNVSESHTYKRGIYDCTDYSREAVKQLKEIGYNATCVFGIYYNRYFVGNDSYNDASAHNWVRVYMENEMIHLEVTQGMNVGIIDEETYRKNYLERILGKCI